MLHVAKIFASGGANATHAKCDETMTLFESDLFSSDDNNVHHVFCDKWSKDKDIHMIVNATGEDMEFYDKKRDVNSFSEWLIDLSYKASDDTSECTTTCRSAYQAMAMACGRLSGK